jgi:glycosyltransferase involved in cell wall biosynthesis
MRDQTLSYACPVEERPNDLLGSNESGPGTISVIVPTYHRPDMLHRAVRSILDQEIPEGLHLEVIVVVSDAGSDTDRAAAENLAVDDHRVRVVLAKRKGPGVARNAGIAEAKGELIGLLDDDCVAQPGWIIGGVRRLGEVELVQGRTEPLGEARGRDRTIWVTGLSGLWESCNLFFRRSVIDRFGGFDENWNPTGKAGQHWGEDAEWGWRVVRQGTTHAYEHDAFVRHEVFHQSFKEWFRYETKVRFFPLAVDDIPELRESFLYERYFLQRRHRTLAIGFALLTFALVLRLFGFKKLAILAAAIAGVSLTSKHAREAYYGIQYEWVSFGAALYGSIKYRRLVL